MDDQLLEVMLYAEPGPENTERTLEVARSRLRALSLEHLVVASDTGKTARRAIEFFGSECSVVVVSNPAGMKLPLSKLHTYLPRFRAYRDALARRGVQAVPVSLTVEQGAALEREGAKVVRIDWRRFQAFTKSGLRSFDWYGVGVRVALCVSVAAHLEGALPIDAEFLALAGTGFGGGGADTAVVVRSAERWLDWRLLEVLARPRVSPPTETG
ncbi:MAG: hypothetical protein JW751_29915 [Polyangiaceae bacterium]|nr:hypothetical protein [Polyangiaceae bacterium]